MTKQPKELALLIAQILRDKRAEELLVLEIAHLTVIADCMVIGNGRSMVQVKALADEVEEKLAERAGLDPTYISGIERGLRNPGIKNVAKIAKALGLTTAELCQGVDA